MNLNLSLTFTILVGFLAFAGFMKGTTKGFASRVLSILSYVIAIFITKNYSSMILSKINISTKTLLANNSFLALPNNVYDICDRALVFIVLLIAIKFIAEAMSSANAIPVFGAFNSLLGGILGAAENLIILVLVINVLNSFTYIDKVQNIVSIAMNSPYIGFLFKIDFFKLYLK